MPLATERASLVPLLAAVLVLVALLTTTVARVGGVLVDSARADAVADSVALAGAIGGYDAAEAVARANRAALAAFEVRDDAAVEITIELAGRTSRAAARSY